jgi:hypothetical protein
LAIGKIMAENKILDTSTEDTIVTALHKGIKRCQEVCDDSLGKRKEILSEYANGWYGAEKKTDYRCPINMVARGINLLLPLLAAKDPKAMTRARVSQLTPYADTLRLTLNHLIRKINMGDTLRTGTLDALCYMGIFKTGIAPGGPGIKDAFGTTHDSGQVFCDVIYPEDYFFDTSARRREEVDFEGNWFYVPVDYVLESGLYENTEFLTESYQHWDKQSPKEITEGGRKCVINTLKPYVRLAEVWIPSENVIVTIPEEGRGTKPLRVVEYNGPAKGPYDVLSFSTFPESIIPIAPLYVNLDLHYYINIMARKMAREAEAAKTVFPYQGNAAGDVERIANAKHLSTVKVDDINAFTTLKLGEISESSYNWVGWLKNLWSEQLGNANLLGGLQSQSPTLGQEQMLMTNATASLDDMIQQVHNVTKSILHKMAFYIFTDPLLDVTISKRISGIGEIPVRVTADTREGDFWDYNFSVEPYSMLRMNPNVRMQKLMQLATGLIIPTLEYAQAQGVNFDVAAFVKNIGKDLELSDGEIDDFYKTALENMNLGPYQPLRGEVSGVGDRLGASMASNQENLNQQQNRAGGQPSPANTKEGKEVRS